MTRRSGHNVQTCTRCVIDSTVPRATFDADGACSYCDLHDLLDREYPLDESGKRRFQAIVDRIKRHGHGKKYDCVIGISGGRDSAYLLYLAKELGLRPLAVHFNDGFGNPTAGENMREVTRILGVDLRTVTSDWRESKDLRIACLKASVPDLNLGCDMGIATALYGVATAENLGYVLIGQSFRTEGIAPLEWNFLDGRYLRSIHNRFGTTELKAWRPEAPGYHLGLREIFYYSVVKRIRVVTPLYYHHYVRSDVDELLVEKLGWVNPGAHYFDDLYQALMQYVLRVKFGIDRRRFNYAALVRSDQMARGDALRRLEEIYAIEDPKVINLCIKRLGLSQEEFDGLMELPTKSFVDYPTNFTLIRNVAPLIRLLSMANLVPKSSYAKYCGDMAGM